MYLPVVFLHFETQVDANDDYVDLSGGEVAEATGFNKAIDVDLGNKATILTKFFKDTKYYGKADIEITPTTRS